MAKLGKNWGPLHPVVEETDKLAKTELPRERQLEIYRFLKLNRMIEDRLSNLYRQGKVVGGLYSSRGQEAISVGSAYAIEPQDMLGPLIRNLGAMLVRGVQPREVMMQYMARADSPTGGKDVQYPLRRPFPRAGGADLHARCPDPGHGGRRRSPAACRRRTRGAHLHRRRRHLDRRLPRGAQLRRRAQRAARGHRREQRLCLLDAVREADADQGHRSRAPRPTASPAEIVDGNDVLAVYEATRGRWSGRAPAAARR